MSLDRSLKTKGTMAGVRSVYTRAERIAKMTEAKKFESNKTSPMGLPKTRITKK